MFNLKAKWCLALAFVCGVAVICGCEADEADACNDVGGTFSFTQPVYAQQFVQPVYAQQVCAQQVYAQPFVQQQVVYAQPFVQRQYFQRQRFYGGQQFRQRSFSRQRVVGGYGGGLNLRVGF